MGMANPFLASAVVMVFAIWLRLNLKESPVFEQVNEGVPSKIALWSRIIPLVRC
jgi:MHS family metabolite:H+ symporter-like MFS transporter